MTDPSSVIIPWADWQAISTISKPVSPPAVARPIGPDGRSLPGGNTTIYRRHDSDAIRTSAAAVARASHWATVAAMKSDSGIPAGCDPSAGSSTIKVSDMSSTPRVKPTYTGGRVDLQDFVNDYGIPIPTGTNIGGNSDKTLVIWDMPNDRVWNLYKVTKKTDGTYSFEDGELIEHASFRTALTATIGGYSGSYIRGDVGALTWQDVQSVAWGADITHALRFNSPVGAGHVDLAPSVDRGDSPATALRYGALYILDSAAPEPTSPPLLRELVCAAKRYGFFAADWAPSLQLGMEGWGNAVNGYMPGIDGQQINAGGELMKALGSVDSSGNGVWNSDVYNRWTWQGPNTLVTSIPWSAGVHEIDWLGY